MAAKYYRGVVLEIGTKQSTDPFSGLSVVQIKLEQPDRNPIWTRAVAGASFSLRVTPAMPTVTDGATLLLRTVAPVVMDENDSNVVWPINANEDYELGSIKVAPQVGEMVEIMWDNWFFEGTLIDFGYTHFFG